MKSWSIISVSLFVCTIFFQNSVCYGFKSNKISGRSDNSYEVTYKKNSKAVSPASFTIVDRNYGVVKIGQTSNSTNTAFVLAGSDASWELGALNFSSGSGFSLVADSCSNVTLSDDQECTFIVSFNSTTPGNYATSATIGGLIIPNDPEQDPFYNEVTWNFRAKARKTDIPPECAAVESGSIIRIDNLSVGEVFELVGTEFDLYYSSEFAKEYNSSVKLTKNSFFQPELIGISSQHYFDIPNSRLFYGYGTSVNMPYTSLPDGSIQVVSLGGDEVFIFDFEGKHLETKNILTGSTKYTFNYEGNNKLQDITDAFLNVTKINRNALGQLISFESPYGLVTSVTLNSSGYVDSISNPKSETNYLVYKTGTELLESLTKPKGQVNTFTYDADGKLIKDESSAGNSISLNLSNLVNGQRIQMTTERGFDTFFDIFFTDSEHYRRVTTYPTGDVLNFTEYYELGGKRLLAPTYSVDSGTVQDERFGSGYKRKSFETLTMDSVGLTTNFNQVIVPSALTDIFNFDSITKTKTALGSILTEVYDSSLKQFTTTSNSGKVYRKKINNNEQTIEVQQGNERKWFITYDTRGRLNRIRQADKKSIIYNYDSNGFLRTTRNSLNETTRYNYNTAGRLIKITLPDQRVINYQYDVNGNLIGVTPPGRPKHSYLYNLFDLVSKYIPPGISSLITRQTIYTYNDDKKITKIDRPDGIDLNYIYSNTTDRLQSIVTTNGTWSYLYGANGEVSTKSSPDGIQTNYTYYGPYVKSESYLDTVNSNPIQVLNFQFNSKHLKSGRSFINGTSITYAYNQDDLYTKIGDMSLTYVYPSGRLRQTRLGNIRDTRTYDVYGDLIGYEAVLLPANTTLYKYVLTRDILGRVSTKVESYGASATSYSYSYDSSGRLDAVLKDGLPFSEYNYDSNSNRISGISSGQTFTATFDDQDKILNYNSNSYTYNANGEMISKQDSLGGTNYSYDAFGNLKGVSLPNGNNVNYLLDGDDRRMLKLVNGSPINYRIYDGAHSVAADYSGLQILQKEYVGGIDVNSSDYIIAGADKYRIIKDHLGSPVLVVHSVSGQIFQEIKYNEFGKILSDTNPGFQPYGFAGGLYDPDTGLTRFGARDYDAEIGRWTSKDPIRFEGGDTNLYGYVLQDPINFVDPSGLVYTREQNGLPGGGGGPSSQIGGPGVSTTSISSYTRHGINRSIGDGGSRVGVCPASIKDTLKNPVDIIKQNDGFYRYEGRNSTIVISPEGRIKTMFPTNAEGVRGGR